MSISSCVTTKCRSPPLVAFVLLLAGCATLNNTATAREQVDSMYVVLGENGTPVARVVTAARECPEIRIDGVDSAMSLRAAGQTLPLRATRSSPADSSRRSSHC